MSELDELARRLVSPAGEEVSLGQGVLRSWNPTTFRGTVELDGLRITDMPVAAGLEAFSFEPGDVVIVEKWFLSGKRGEHGLGSFAIRGKITTPGEDVGVLTLRGGQVVIATEEGLTISGGGSIDVQDGGTIRARYDDGTQGVLFGSLIDQETGDPSGHGLLVQDNGSGDQDDIFRAKRNEDGSTAVWIGWTLSIPDDVGPVDQFLADSALTRLRTYGPSGMELATYGSGGDPDTSISQATSVNVQSGNQINLRTPDGPAVRVDALSTGDSPNAVILSPNGTIGESTSARRFKTSIEDYQADIDAVMRLRPRTWRDRWAVECDPGTEAWHVGLVAEEVDELGLNEFVDYDVDGAPKRVTYDRLCVALLQVVQSQQERLTALETAAGVTPWAVSGEPTRKPKRLPIADMPDDQAPQKVGAAQGLTR